MTESLSEQMTIADRRAAILSQMDNAAQWAGRKDADYALVAVSKMQPDTRIIDALKAGQYSFGENRVQEARQRWDERLKPYRADIELRLIGPLQTNKAAEAAALFDVIETLDRDKLARAILSGAEKAGRLPRLYVQVNTGAEPQKAGVLPAALPDFLKRLKDEYDLTPEGLMCIPPVSEAASPHFWWLANLAADHGLKKLSMGMSGDYETAIKMGATSVRVGSALFGERLAQ